MTYKYNFLEWEVTTACNAACPQCPRNYYGGKTWENLPIIQNNLKWAQDHLPESFIQNLDRIDFCGTYGDPILNNSLVEIINWLLSVNANLKVTIKTNGGLRNAEWWAQLAQVLGSNGSVFFGIDGLEDTNHLYRRKVNFDQVMQNTQAFINAGGNAFWNFIVFRHNQHQVDNARQLSEQLGFKGFHSKLTSRFFNKKHELQESLVVFDDHGEPEYTIEMPDDPRYINESYKKIEIIKQTAGSLDDFFKNSVITCKCKNWSRIYLSAEGYIFPCGWLHDRMYGFEAEQHSDRMQLEHLFELAGGSKFANVNHTPIDNIVDGPWFETLMASWSNNTRLNRCEVMCGEQINLIGNQNKLVKTF